MSLIKVIKCQSLCHCVKVLQSRLKGQCLNSRARVLFNIPGCRGNTPPLRVSDVLNLHGNEDRLCCDDGPLNHVKRHSHDIKNTLLRQPKHLGVGKQCQSESSCQTDTLSVESVTVCVCAVKEDTKQPQQCLLGCLIILFEWLAGAANQRLWPELCVLNKVCF